MNIAKHIDLLLLKDLARRRWIEGLFALLFCLGPSLAVFWMPDVVNLDFVQGSSMMLVGFCTMFLYADVLEQSFVLDALPLRRRVLSTTVIAWTVALPVLLAWVGVLVSCLAAQMQALAQFNIVYCLLMVPVLAAYGGCAYCGLGLIQHAHAWWKMVASFLIVGVIVLPFSLKLAGISLANPSPHQMVGLACGAGAGLLLSAWGWWHGPWVGRFFSRDVFSPRQDISLPSMAIMQHDLCYGLQVGLTVAALFAARLWFGKNRMLSEWICEETAIKLLCSVCLVALGASEARIVRLTGTIWVLRGLPLSARQLSHRILTLEARFLSGVFMPAAVLALLSGRPGLFAVIFVAGAFILALDCFSLCFFLSVYGCLSQLFLLGLFVVPGVGVLFYERMCKGLQGNIFEHHGLALVVSVCLLLASLRLLSKLLTVRIAYLY